MENLEEYNKKGTQEMSVLKNSVLHLCEVCNLLTCSIRHPVKEMQSAEFTECTNTKRYQKIDKIIVYGLNKSYSSTSNNKKWERLHKACED